MDPKKEIYEYIKDRGRVTMDQLKIRFGKSELILLNILRSLISEDKIQEIDMPSGFGIHDNNSYYEPID